jgi:hypothetical protein
MASRALDSRGCPESFARTLYQDITDIVFAIVFKKIIFFL